MNEVNPLFSTYLSLLRVSTRLFPDLTAIWQLAPAPIRDAIPSREILTELQQQVKALEINACCLLFDLHFHTVLRFLKNPPPVSMIDETGSLLPVKPDDLQRKPYTNLQVADDPTAWLLTKLKIPCKLHSFRNHAVSEVNEDGNQFTAYRSSLSLTLGDIEIGITANTAHHYKKRTIRFDLKQQQEEIAQQLAVALQAVDNQLVEETSCLCCYGLQIFAVTEKVQMLHQRFQEFYTYQNKVEV